MRNRVCYEIWKCCCLSSRSAQRRRSVRWLCQARPFRADAHAAGRTQNSLSSAPCQASPFPSCISAPSPRRIALSDRSRLHLGTRDDGATSSRDGDRLTRPCRETFHLVGTSSTSQGQDLTALRLPSRIIRSRVWECPGKAGLHPEDGSLRVSFQGDDDSHVSKMTYCLDVHPLA